MSPKRAVLELDKRTTSYAAADLLKINPDGSKTKVMTIPAVQWGKYLRYNYAICDFSALKDPGIYHDSVRRCKLKSFQDQQ